MALVGEAIGEAVRNNSWLLTCKTTSLEILIMAPLSQSSPFFHTPATAHADSLAILHLKRDSLTPVKLATTADDGYAEGPVTNTRFGSFPHSTLIGLEWGSQVRASKVDTGSRGRKKKPKQQEAKTEQDGGVEGEGDSASKKRKQDKDSSDSLESPVKKAKTAKSDVPLNTTEEQRVVVRPLEAGTGFLHILQPTPESWTSSLSHRTQVVYTPDYSYILQHLRVRPGSTIIEAGAGSGSFTHAAARAIFNGYSDGDSTTTRKLGRVCSYEYHEPRIVELRRELSEHSLNGVVQLTHRDVCNDGFHLADGSSPRTNAVFLDLPAPWQAIKHLTRAGPSSPLDPQTPIHICSFSPCIEQVTATVAALRKAGWTDISMVEIMNKRIDVRRERIGLKEEGLRGVNARAASVAEAVERLREDVAEERKLHTKKERLEKLKQEAEVRKLYKEGNLAHRTEPEVRTHTSYLVFAVLTQDWTEDDERAAAEKYSVDAIMSGSK